MRVPQPRPLRLADRALDRLQRSTGELRRAGGLSGGVQILSSMSPKPKRSLGADQANACPEPVEEPAGLRRELAEADRTDGAD